MEQPELRYLANRNPDDRYGKMYIPKMVVAEINVTGPDADRVVYHAEAGQFIKVTGVIVTALNGTTPTADVGIASDEDLIIDQTAWAEDTVGSNATGNIYFSAAGNITIDTTSGNADLTAGKIMLILEIWDLTDMAGDPDVELTLV